jgi:hypothetical protein
LPASVVQALAVNMMERSETIKAMLVKRISVLESR